MFKFIYISLLAVFTSIAFIGSSSAQSSNSTLGVNINTPKINGLVIESIETQPIPKELKELSKKQHRQMKKRGFADASEDEVTVLERYSLQKNQKHIKQMQEIEGRLAMQPSILTGTPFEDGKFIGAILAGAQLENGRTAIGRLYQIPKLGLVKLEENDYLLSGGGILLAKEFINENINGHPAVLMVKESLSGKSLTELIWITDSKVFTLTISKKLFKNDDEMLLFMTLARSVH